MSKLITRPATVATTRRGFIANSGGAVLSASAVALLMGCESMAAKPSMQMAKADPAADVAILNVALGLEWEAINAYQLGAESGLLKKPVLDTAVLFQTHHKEHADALVATIMKFGGKPVAAKAKADYAKDLNAATLKTDLDVLRLAARLERGAANAYLGVIPSFADATLAQVAARLATDETMHWTVLATALGQPVPTKALSFGA
jgi:rubrerythrin